MSTALYRRYRPETFNEVIGQEHVTEPLMAALAAGRVTHAYLFSGPRGCGKTSSARIFARCLNCAEGPTANPCGTCDSCVELGRGGSGSLDVVEIDAASHNGVDDARDLRERAAFAPARDRYKIFILDEAHMVTTQGFNALLKLVEEPPEHVKFIFATTEPEKVIGTIRSRTHHYPFRLVPPGTLTGYLESLCVQEGVDAGAGVLPMVVRAGGGSVRDSLSVLDQLMAGSVGSALDYERAAALLGYTSTSLLDDAVSALAAHDGGALFQVVDRMVQSGHDPRRFVEDFLQRLRDLVIIAVAGEAAGPALGPVPADQLAQMQEQARLLGAPTASRAADLTNAALSEMTGATSPRLQLELLCARLLISPTAARSGGEAAQRPQSVAPASQGRGGSTPPPAAAPAVPQSAAQGGPASAPSGAQQAPGAAEARPTGPQGGRSAPDDSTNGVREGVRGSSPLPSTDTPAGHTRPETASERPATPPASAPAATGSAAAMAAAARRATQALRGGAQTPGGGSRSANGTGSAADAERPAAAVQREASAPADDAGAAARAATPSQPAGELAGRGQRATAPAEGSQGSTSLEPAPPAPETAPTQPAGDPEPAPSAPLVEQDLSQEPSSLTNHYTNDRDSSGRAPEPAESQASAGSQPSTQAQAPDQAPPTPAQAPAQAADSSSVDTAMVRRRWSEVLATLAQIRRASWVLVDQSATPGEVRNGVMSLVFETEGLKAAFVNGRHEDNVVAALEQTLGVKVRIAAETGSAAAAPTRDISEPEPAEPEPEEEPYGGASADDDTIEGSTEFGVPVIERLLDGTLVAEENG